MKRIHLCALTLLLSFCQGALAKDVTTATIYYVSWFSMTRSALSIDNVRAHCDIRIEVLDRDRARGLADELRHRKFEPEQTPPHPDTRLVVDLLMDDGTTQTWFADRIRIYSPDGASSAAIDRDFRLQFDFFERDLESELSPRESPGR